MTALSKDLFVICDGGSFFNSLLADLNICPSLNCCLLSYLCVFVTLVLSSRLVLKYEREFRDEERPDFCEGHDPSVTVTLVCPQGRRREVIAGGSSTYRGGSQGERT